VVLVVSNCSTTSGERSVQQNVAEISDSIISFKYDVVDYCYAQFAVRHHFYSIAAIQP